MTKPTDECYTPPMVFDAMGLTFDLDVCAPPGGVPWVPAANHFCLADDGLNQEWFGRVWMNPPYSQSTQWVEKFIEHANGVCLVPFSKSTWFDNLWQSADAIVPLVSRTKFIKGGRPHGIFMPVFLAAFGDDNAAAIDRVGTARRIA